MEPGDIIIVLDEKQHGVSHDIFLLLFSKVIV